MIDVTWKIFSLTGNIEAYLLLKELEKNDLNDEETNININDNISVKVKG